MSALSFYSSILFIYLFFNFLIRYEMKNDSYPVLTSEEIKVTATLQSYIINIKEQQQQQQQYS